MNSREGWSPVALVRSEAKAGLMSGEIVIGKDVLELLTGAMYSDPLMIFREYVQNSADAIDELLSTSKSVDKQPAVEISLDVASRAIVIRDTGVGIPNEAFQKRLTALGGSEKRGKDLRGFRGVGRLSGLGYCRELVFRSRTSRKEPVLELVWDGRRLRELLRDPSYGEDLKALIQTITTVCERRDAEFPERFFEVELRGVARIKNDGLLDGNLIANYLSEVAPVSFDPDFSRGGEISEFLGRNGLPRPTNVSLRAGDARVEIVRPHGNTIAIGNSVSPIGEVEYVTLEGLEGEVAGVGWILHHDYLGSIPRDSRIEGLRVRCGNIQIGGSRLLEELFPETRFNSWCVGEFHVLSPKVVPNGRRDNFEATATWQDLQGKFASIGAILTRHCRARSIARNRLNRLRKDFRASVDLLDVIAVRSRFDVAGKDSSKVVAEALKRLEHAAASTNLAPDARHEVLAMAKALSSKAKRSSRSNRDPLAFLPKQKREAYQEIFAHMLHNTRNARECVKLIDSIVTGAKRRAKTG
jgi:hypothetical protein